MMVSGRGKDYSFDGQKDHTSEALGGPKNRTDVKASLGLGASEIPDFR